MRDSIYSSQPLNLRLTTIFTSKYNIESTPTKAREVILIYSFYSL